jgi:hypothetical protein
MLRLREKLVLFSTMLAAAALIGALARLLSLSAAATDGLIGAALALFAAYGVPYAFGVSPGLLDAEC